MKILPMVGVCAVVAAATLMPDDTSPRPSDSTPAQADPEAVDRWQAHYAQVLEEMRQHTPAGLDAARLQRRAEMIEELAAYRETTALFPVNTFDAERRLPGFEDAAGRHCAVAHLMDVSGADELLATFVRESPHAYIMDLRDDARLQAWVDGVGLTLLEAARIHAPLAPSSPGGGPTAGTTVASGNAGPATPAPLSAAGPKRPSASTTACPPRNVTSGNTGARTRGAPTFKGARRPGARTGGASGRDDGEDRFTGLADTDWWEWWEMNKARYLRPSSLIEDQDPFSPAGRYAIGPKLPEGVTAARRQEVLALVELDLDHSDPVVRGSAAVSYGRLAGAAAVGPLLARLDDTSVFVRNCTVLGLGATGSPAAATVLVQVAENGRIPGSTDSVSAYGRSLAVVALGIGRRYGMPESVDGFVEEILAGMAGDEEDEVGTAVFIYDALTPSKDFISPAQEALTDRKVNDAMRCRAAQALVQHGDPALNLSLVRALAGDSLELRRAAALALGAMPDEHVLQRLLTAFELESDALTRGFSLISIGEQGTEQARDYLMLQLRRGENVDRPWAALGLGVLARATGDEVAMAAVRTGLGRESNADSRGAYVLASGLAGDPKAVKDLSERLVEAADPRQRMFAALSLGMIEDGSVRPLLLERLEEESWPPAHAAVAQAVGFLGHDDDSAVLVAALADLRDPTLRNQVTVAAGFHGSVDTVDGLMQLLRDRRTKDAARAAALDALGLLLDDQPGMLLAEVSADSNYEAFPDWVNSVLSTFVL